jgi:hypothetical protein
VTSFYLIIFRSTSHILLIPLLSATCYVSETILLQAAEITCTDGEKSGAALPETNTVTPFLLVPISVLASIHSALEKDSLKDNFFLPLFRLISCWLTEPLILQIIFSL